MTKTYKYWFLFNKKWRETSSLYDYSLEAITCRILTDLLFGGEVYGGEEVSLFVKSEHEQARFDCTVSLIYSINQSE